MIKADKRVVDTKYGEIDLITLKSEDMEVILTSFGAAIYQIKVFGNLVTVAPQAFDDFFQSTFYYGKTIGRTSGRLVLPSFKINHAYYPIRSYRGEKVKLHGGPTGFSFRHFKLCGLKIKDEEASVSFCYRAMHMEEDYPGEMDVIVTYTLNRDMELMISYQAQTDHDTLCNLTNHTYFNLSTTANHIYYHDMIIRSKHYLDINEDNIILSQKPTLDTPFDFNQKTRLGERIMVMKDTPFNGFDHTWLLDDIPEKIEIDEPSSPVKLIIETSYPAVVIYTHNHPAPSKLEQIKNDGTHSSFTLECQFEPGGIHYPYLNDNVLKKDETYKHYIRYKFVEK